VLLQTEVPAGRRQQARREPLKTKCQGRIGKGKLGQLKCDELTGAIFRRNSFRVLDIREQGGGNDNPAKKKISVRTRPKKKGDEDQSLHLRQKRFDMQEEIQASSGEAGGERSAATQQAGRRESSAAAII